MLAVAEKLSKEEFVRMSVRYQNTKKRERLKEAKKRIIEISAYKNDVFSKRFRQHQIKSHPKFKR